MTELYRGSFRKGSQRFQSASASLDRSTQLNPGHRTLTELTSAIETMNATSVLKQMFMTSDISAMITRAYADIDTAAKELQVRWPTI